MRTLILSLAALVAVSASSASAQATIPDDVLFNTLFPAGSCTNTCAVNKTVFLPYLERLRSDDATEYDFLILAAGIDNGHVTTEEMGTSVNELGSLRASIKSQQQYSGTEIMAQAISGLTSALTNGTASAILHNSIFAPEKSGRSEVSVSYEP
jgi:hypothetical protein